MRHLARFAVSSAILGSAMLGLASPAAAQYRSVVVDTSPIAEEGRPAFAEKVRRAVEPSVAEAFAAQVNPGDPRGLRLVVRIRSVTLPLVTGGFGSSQNDFMKSEALVVDGRGRVVASTPVVLSPVTAFAPANLPIDVEEYRRIRNLGQHAAGWLKRELPVL